MRNAQCIALHRAMCNAAAMTDAQLIGSAEACALLNIDRSTLTRWIAAGKLAPASKMPGSNGAFVFARAVIEALAQTAAGAR